MPRNDARGAAAWVRRWWRPAFSELLSTALLVWLGIAAIVPLGGPMPILHPAFSFGCMVLGLVMACGPTSGAHMNPAVTLAALVHGRIAPATAALYVVAQLVGALLGFGALLAVSPAAATTATKEGEVAFGCTAPSHGVTPVAAAAIEAAITGVLALACCGVWAAHDDARPDHSIPIKLGLVVAGLVFVAGPATGASLNPARSFAPAVFQGFWSSHWVYWVGPLGGAAIAALVHRFLLMPPAPAPVLAPEDHPLADKP